MTRRFIRSALVALAAVALLTLVAPRPAWAPDPECPSCTIKESQFEVKKEKEKEKEKNSPSSELGSSKPSKPSSGRMHEADKDFTQEQQYLQHEKQ